VIAARNGKRQSARLVSVGSYVPERVVTNAELARTVDTTDEWIVTRTGIRERRFAAPDEAASDMALIAAEEIMAQAGVAPSELDFVIVPTSTPDHFFPSTAAILAERIGARGAAAYDLSAACAGFVYGLSQAAALVESGLAGHVLVVGSDQLGKMQDMTDRSTCILFGDAAGGALISAGDESTTGGFLGFEIGADGSGADLLTIPAGGSRQPITAETPRAEACIQMNGREVFKFATRVMIDSPLRLLERLEMSIDEIDLLIAHQANSRIIEHAVKRLGIAPEKVFNNLERYGNTSAASIPLAMKEARDLGRMRPGDLLLLVGFGGGLTWGTTIVRYEPVSPEATPA
jgi:3-oxoacyl-[acyl-carrier-protein] synthase III